VSFRSIDPASGEVVWEGPAARPDACTAAVDRARATFPAWRRTQIDERAAILEGYAALLKRDEADLAELIARETGKPLWESRTEVATMGGKVALSIKAQSERAGERFDDTGFGQAGLRHHPHGVMAVLGPYNFPGHLPNGHIVPALLAGNCVVFKPSEHTPAVGERLVALLSEAGVPEGAVEILQGGRDTGAALLACPVDGVLFTGSAQGGKAVREAFIDRPEAILALELGGNNPLIAWDGDIDVISEIVVQSAFITTGQRCSCARRLIVPAGDVGNRIVDALLGRIKSLRIGAWNDAAEPFMGPLIADAAADAVLTAQSRLIELGAVPLRRMERLPQSRAFVGPGVLDGTGLDLPDEEIFAPLLTVYRASDFSEAVELANCTRFGLASGIISDDDALWRQFIDEARAGVINRNRPTTGASGAMPFGGLGESGNHRPSAYYAADYCAYPVASLVADRVVPLAPLPGS
jgi:succinylglutamic semialdehyde dehydrogenase